MEVVTLCPNFLGLEFSMQRAPTRDWQIEKTLVGMGCTRGICTSVKFKLLGMKIIVC